MQDSSGKHLQPDGAAAAAAREAHYAPAADAALNQEALDNLAKAWPVFGNAEIEQSWGGMIEITPDSHPVISTVDEFPGLVIATGFSGHGFGTSPAAGQLAADLAMHTAPLVDPAPYRLDRF